MMRCSSWIVVIFFALLNNAAAVAFHNLYRFEDLHFDDPSEDSYSSWVAPLEDGRVGIVKWAYVSGHDGTNLVISILSEGGDVERAFSFTYPEAHPFEARWEEDGGETILNLLFSDSLANTYAKNLLRIRVGEDAEVFTNIKLGSEHQIHSTYIDDGFLRFIHEINSYEPDGYAMLVRMNLAGIVDWCYRFDYSVYEDDWFYFSFGKERHLVFAYDDRSLRKELHMICFDLNGEVLWNKSLSADRLIEATGGVPDGAVIRGANIDICNDTEALVSVEFTDVNVESFHLAYFTMNSNGDVDWSCLFDDEALATVDFDIPYYESHYVDKFGRVYSMDSNYYSILDPEFSDMILMQKPDGRSFDIRELPAGEVMLTDLDFSGSLQYEIGCTVFDINGDPARYYRKFNASKSWFSVQPAALLVHSFSNFSDCWLLADSLDELVEFGVFENASVFSMQHISGSDFNVPLTESTWTLAPGESDVVLLENPPLEIHELSVRHVPLPLAPVTLGELKPSQIATELRLNENSNHGVYFALPWFEYQLSTSENLANWDNGEWVGGQYGFVEETYPKSEQPFFLKAQAR